MFSIEHNDKYILYIIFRKLKSFYVYIIKYIIVYIKYYKKNL